MRSQKMQKATFAAVMRRTLAPVAMLPAATLMALSLATAPALATKIERVVSPGGIEAWLVSDSTVPVIAVQFAFTGGTSQDPRDRTGLASMVTSLLTEGAGELDAAAFQQRMEREAVELRFSADRDHLRGSLRTLSERREAAFEMLGLAVSRPRFDDDSVARVRAQTEARIRRESRDPSSIASREWWARAFPNHPYGTPQRGTLESVAAITAADLRAYAGRVLARDTLKVAIVGDIDAATVATMLDRVFGGLPARAELAPVADAAPAGTGGRAVESFDTPQAVVVLGGAGLPRKHPDFMALFVANHILGGGSFSSWLYREVREKRGLAYGVSTSAYPLDHSPLMMGWTQVRADRVGESIAVMEAEIRRMAEEGPTAEELAEAKEYLTGSYALRFDSSTKIAAQLVQIQLDELGIDYINRRNAEISAVTLDDVRRTARAVFSAPLAVLVVGRPEGVEAVKPANPG